ncbi:MAG: 1,4-alpha-glucan branching protein GlgB [bacterium]
MSPKKTAGPGTTPAAVERRNTVHHDVTLLTDEDLRLFNEGTHDHLYDKLGAHPLAAEGGAGTYFAVWAPGADRVSVIGDFNGWAGESHPLASRAQSGIWEGFIPDAGKGERYKFQIVSGPKADRMDKADPFAFCFETPPKTASVVWELEHSWGDRTWMEGRRKRNALDAPMALYEVHLGSWRRVGEEGNRRLTYRELAAQLPEYVRRMGFTHVEILPVMEHPFYGSWGYQVTSYFGPTRRYGSPQDFMHLIDALHQQDIGVILDWVPSHFPSDAHGLARFDGGPLYEHAEPRRGLHPEWGSLIFNYGRGEVQSFLLSSALFWLEKYHVDGLRVDAVTSMLYLDYARKDGEWLPNPNGGRENLEAVAFLRRLNEKVSKRHPDVLTIAEESTDWPKVSRPASAGGLGFDLKWDMGWMHDTLNYMGRGPGIRKHHHDKITFRSLYAFSESFVLPLSHDEVVHGKSSLLGKMPGDDGQKFANLRLLFGYMYAQPGKKLIFMGGELGQWGEWNHEGTLDWHLLAYAPHVGLQKWVEGLNRLYTSEAALHVLDCDKAGFEWIDGSNSLQSVVSFIRRGRSNDATVLAVCNFTMVPRFHYPVGVPLGGFWREVLNGDALEYGGGGIGNLGGVTAAPDPRHGRPYSLDLTLPPLAAVFFKSEGGNP